MKKGYEWEANITNNERTKVELEFVYPISEDAWCLFVDLVSKFDSGRHMLRAKEIEYHGHEGKTHHQG